MSIDIVGFQIVTLRKHYFVVPFKSYGLKNKHDNYARKIERVLWFEKFKSVTLVQNEYWSVFREEYPHENNIQNLFTKSKILCLKIFYKTRRYKSNST